MTPEEALVLARYNAWANRHVFDAVAALPEGEALRERKTIFRNIVHTLNHNYVIDRIWQAHLEGREHGYGARNTHDTPPLAELWRAQQEIDAWYVAWCERQSERSLGESIDFTLVGGKRGRMTRAQVLLHLFNHTTYHRGYVADMFYQVPAAPPTTDLPVFLREAAG